MSTTYSKLELIEGINIKSDIYGKLHIRKTEDNGIHIISGMIAIMADEIKFNNKFKYITLKKNGVFVGTVNSLMDDYDEAKAFILQCITSECVSYDKL